jgi:hypothetical protein
VLLPSNASKIISGFKCSVFLFLFWEYRIHIDTARRIDALKDPRPYGGKVQWSESTDMYYVVTSIYKYFQGVFHAIPPSAPIPGKASIKICQFSVDLLDKILQNVIHIYCVASRLQFPR